MHVANVVVHFALIANADLGLTDAQFDELRVDGAEIRRDADMAVKNFS